GIRAWSEQSSGYPPVVVEGADGWLAGGAVTIKGGASSQFLSALLMVAPYAENPVDIKLDGVLVSAPYVDMTIAMMQQWGFVLQKQDDSYHIENVDRTYDRLGHDLVRLSYN